MKPRKEENERPGPGGQRGKKRTAKLKKSFPTPILTLPSPPLPTLPSPLRAALGVYPLGSLSVQPSPAAAKGFGVLTKEKRGGNCGK